MVFVLSGCGGGGGSTAQSSASVATKGVVYPVVVGLTYQTNTASGVVASDGSYTYKANENVTFSAGGIELATVPAASKVTPLPLDNDVASTNLLRLLKALDSDGNLSNGVSLSSLATSALTSVDLTSEASVLAALASLAPSATLPSASDAQIATALTNAKTTALQDMGAYGSTYRAISVNTSTLPGLPKDAVVNLTSQPNWTTGAVTGTAVLTLNDNSKITLPLINISGSYSASGTTFDYKIRENFASKSRIIYLSIYPSKQSNSLVVITLRDNAQPNMPPIPRLDGKITIDYSLTPNAPSVYHYASTPPGSLMGGSEDLDGFVVSQAWSSSKGKTGTGNTFSESFSYNEKGSITLTVTDDEGATASKTWPINSNASGSGDLFTSSMLNGKTITVNGNGITETLSFNSDGTWTGVRPDNATLGTWSIDGSGRLIAKYNWGGTVIGNPTYETMTLTIVSGSLPTFNVSYSDLDFDGSTFSGSGTITIGSAPTNTGLITVGW